MGGGGLLNIPYETYVGDGYTCRRAIERLRFGILVGILGLAGGGLWVWDFGVGVVALWVCGIREVGSKSVVCFVC